MRLRGDKVDLSQLRANQSESNANKETTTFLL